VKGSLVSRIFASLTCLNGFVTSLLRLLARADWNIFLDFGIFSRFFHGLSRQFEDPPRSPHYITIDIRPGLEAFPVVVIERL
jgi:hypothetical protein